MSFRVLYGVFKRELYLCMRRDTCKTAADHLFVFYSKNVFLIINRL